MPRSKLVLLAVSAMALFSFGGQTRSSQDLIAWLTSKLPKDHNN